ncbi:MAG: protoporphyrinogen oxidase HemJ [Alphaproteobacteria bacterium]|nr:protoporphyrinogen oxidase HemJ [Alphaproteobacteria bacterium]
MDATYITFKIIHVIAIICWLAGMFYLPRLFVYHAEARGGTAATLATMERRLLRVIINPAMIIALLSGFYLMTAGGFMTSGWLHAKLLFVLLLTALHGLFAYHRKQLANGRNKKSARYFRIINELPTVIMVVIVILVIAKPF